MIKAEDLHDMGYVDDQLDMFEYWQPQGEEPTYQQLVQKFIDTSGQTPTPELYLRLIKEEFEELLEAEPGTTDELKELADLLYVAFGYAIAMKYDLDKAFKLVHENNYGRMFQPDGTIKRREDGKIVKNKDYPKVNLTDCIN